MKVKVASRMLRSKAFLVDVFMIYVPILYLFYFILGSKEAFLNSNAAFFCVVLFGLIQGFFLFLKAQSPGFKAYDLYLMNTKTGKKASFLQILFRYVLFILSFGLVFGLFVSFIRKDSLNLHDFLSKTCVVFKI